MPERPQGWQARLRRGRRRVQVWTKRRLPPGLRLVAGLLLMVAGIFGFLPVIGFWMFPLGVAVAALDVVPIWRWLRWRLGGARREGERRDGERRDGERRDGQGRGPDC